MFDSKKRISLNSVRKSKISNFVKIELCGTYPVIRINVDTIVSAKNSVGDSAREKFQNRKPTWIEKSTNFGSTKINFAKLRSDGKSLGIIFTYLKSVKIIDTRKKSF